MQNYYFHPDGYFAKRSKFPKYFRAVISCILVICSFVYVEQQIIHQEQITQETITKQESSYIDWVTKNSKLDFEESKELVKSVIKNSIQFSIDEKLLFSVIKVESNFDQYAISNAGALGFMQVMSAPHADKLKAIKKESGKVNPFDLNTNIFLGSRILFDCQKKHGVNTKALKCYNGSVGQSTNYDKKVMDVYSELRKMK